MKKYIIPVAAFIAGMAIVPSVFAAEGGPADPLKAWGANIAPCLSGDADATCTLADDADLTFTNGQAAKVTKNMVLDLNGKTVSLGSTWGGIEIEKDASLTITNGAVEDDGYTSAIAVKDGGSLTIDVDAEVDVAGEAHSHVVLNAGHTLIGDIKMTGDKPNTFGNYEGTAATAEINGTLNGAYSQTDNVNGTINGKVENGAYVTGKGALTLNHATVSGYSAVVLSGADSVLNVEGCSVLTATAGDGIGAALFIAGTPSKVTINNSTLKNANGSAINGDADTTVETMTINGSRFEAKAETAVKAGATVFTHATYDGRALADEENVLTVAKGTYGVDTVVCDAPAAEPGDEAEGDDAENPNTADTIATYMTIAAVALLGLGATAFVAKKSNR